MESVVYGQTGVSLNVEFDFLMTMQFYELLKLNQ